nr:MAG TPA: Toprim-like [Caudoviricetes sp.]
MFIDRETKEYLIKELEIELHAKLDGGRKNLIVPTCPYCGKQGGKFGIFVGAETEKKKLFMSHCFSCGHTTKDINQLLDDIGRPDLKVEETASFNPLEVPEFFGVEEDEIDDELEEVEMPEGYKRCYKNRYLKSRGFEFEDYDYFPVGTTRGLNFKFDDYVIFPIIDNSKVVGYVSRHIWNKADIDEYNNRAKRNGKYQIRRYNNSLENDFIKLLYNYDTIIEDETDTVIIVEGIFDVISLTRKLDLYENNRVSVVATFGKKISDTQIYKLQSKGVRTVVIGYDSDAMEAINKAANQLNEYFDVYIAKIDSDGKDWDEMPYEDIYQTFSYNLCTPVEYKLQTI